MNHIRLSLLALCCLAFAACNNNDEDCVDYIPSCDTVEPTEGTLSIAVTISADNPAVPIAVYYGYIEDSSLYFRDTLTTKNIGYAVPFGRYSVSARYRKGNDQILAIDGGNVRYKTNTDCDYTCYTLVEGDVDLRLK